MSNEYFVHRTILCSGNSMWSSQYINMSGKAAKLLRELREKAGLSLKEMADLVDRPKSTYQSKEDVNTFKKDSFPPEWYSDLAHALISKGISELEVLPLGGSIKMTEGRTYARQIIFHDIEPFDIKILKSIIIEALDKAHGESNESIAEVIIEDYRDCVSPPEDSPTKSLRDRMKKHQIL